MKRTFLFLFLTSSLLFGAGELSHRRAPGFSIFDAAMQQHDLYDYRGKYVIIEFMQTGCPHCIKFAEIIEQLMIKHRGKVEALSITVPPDTLDTVRYYIKQHNITIPVLFDCGQVAASYLRQGPSSPHVTLPHAFIVDRDGMIVNDWVYAPGNESIFEGDGLAKEFDRLLAGKK
jgi:peroxiredoxin